MIACHPTSLQKTHHHYSVFESWSGFITSYNSSIQVTVNSDISLTAKFTGVNNYFTFDGDSNIPEIKNAILSLLNDCATRYLLDNNLYLHGQIPIEKSSSLSLFSWGPVSHTIKWNVAGFDNTNLFLIHELFHAYQHGVDTVNTGRNINNEIESFMAQYKYCEKYNLLECLPGTVQGWRDSFGAYLISPTSENYDIMINYVRNLQQGAYTESEFPDIATKRNIDNINSIFTCY